MPRRTPRRPGRPTKFTPDTTRRIIKAVRRGAQLEAAAFAAGVHPSTVYKWLAAGEQADEQDAKQTPFREFFEALTHARAKAEMAMVAAVVQDAQGGAVVKHLTRTWRNGTVEEEHTYAPPNGRVALEYLARVHPDRWGRKTGVEVTGAGGGPVQMEQSVAIIGSLADRLHARLAATGVVIAGELVAADDDGDGDAVAS